MDLFSAEKERRKQRQINQYLSTRYHYSAKGRKDAVRFERRRAIRRRAAALAKLSEELTRCQAVYLNCLHQAGTAHRLAQLIEKVEQIAVSDAQSAQKSNPQEYSGKLPCVRPEQSANSNKLSSKLIKTAFQNEACLSLLVERETQLTIESKRSIDERTRTENDDCSSREINGFGQETVQSSDRGRSDKTSGGMKKKPDEKPTGHLGESSNSFEEMALEFEFIYSINERSAAQSGAQSAAQSKSQPEIQLETAKETKKSTGGQSTVEEQVVSDESFARKLVETIERSKMESLETEDTFTVGPSSGRKLFKEINYLDDNRTENVQRNEAASREKTDLKADKTPLDAGETACDKQSDKQGEKAIGKRSGKQSGKQDDKQDGRQTNDWLACKQIPSQFGGKRWKQTNELKESQRLADNGEFNPGRSRQLSVQPFEESGGPNAGEQRGEASAESRPDRRPDCEAERSDFKSDQRTNGSKALRSSKTNAADPGLSHELNYSLAHNLDLDPDLAGHRQHRHRSEEVRQVGKDAIKGEQLSRTIERTDGQPNQIRANETADAPVSSLTDYAGRESYREFRERLYELYERYEVSSERGEHVGCRLDPDNGCDSSRGNDERGKLNARDPCESKIDRQMTRQKARQTAEQTIRRYLPDDLEENLSLRTPSPTSLNRSLESRLFDSADELPDLRLFSPTLSSCSSFPSIDSLSSLISADELARFSQTKCPVCLICAAKQGVEVKQHGENGKESERGRGTERDAKDASRRTASKKDYETLRKRVERKRQRKTVETNDGKRIEKFSFQAFWDEVLGGRSASEGRLPGLDRLKRQLKRQLAECKPIQRTK